MKKVYVAGPWVFRPDAEDHAEYLRRTLHNAGYEALIPIDNESDNPVYIKLHNMSMIDTCDYIIADLTPFRGPSADVGTAFEIGYGFAMRKVPFLWSCRRSEYKDRVRYGDNYNIEDFGLCDNLMLTAGMIIRESFDEAIKAMIQWDGITDHI